MKKPILFFAAFSIASAVMAQTDINADVLKTIQSSHTETVADKAIRNALAGNSVAALTANANTLTEIGTDFSDVVPTKGVTNQLSSWSLLTMFTSTWIGVTS